MAKTKPSTAASDMVPVPREIVVLVASLLLGAAGGGGADYLNAPTDDGLSARVAAVESKCDAIPAVERRLGAVEATTTTTNDLVGDLFGVVDWAHPRER